MDKAKVINNFIDDQKILKLSNEKIKETKPKNKKVFLFVGRIDESSKNFTRMINSFKLVYEQNKNVMLWIVGSGPDEKLLEKLVEDNNLEKAVKILGRKENPYPYIKKCDYVILTSNYEGFPVIYGEAITLGKKIISTIDVSDEYISIPNNFGYITKKDENDISKTILNILKHDTLKYKSIDISLVNKNRKEMLNQIINN